MKKCLPLAILAFLGMMVPAAAQTAEEAVAYVFLGLADGAKLERGSTTMSWVETAASPATFDGDAVISGHPSKIRFTVKTLEDCRYEITLEGPEVLVPGGNRLFARVALRDVSDIAIDKDGFKSTFNGIGFCETGRRNTNCMTVENTDLFGAVDADRHRDAIAFLRDEVCTKPN
jgi:hypothetical protein